MIILISDIDQSTDADEIEALIHEYCAPTSYEVIDTHKNSSLSVAIDIPGSSQYVEHLAERIDGREWKGHKLHAHPMLFFHNIRQQPHTWHRH